MKLTKKAIDAVTASGKRAFLWDTELRGFGLKIEASGTKTFVLRFRSKGSGQSGPKRFMTLGRYGVVTVDQARNEAKSILGRVAKGDDPSLALQPPSAVTLAQLVDRYLAQLPGKKKTTTCALYTHHLKMFVVPALGDKKALEVTHADIMRLHAEIGATRAVTANRVIATISGMYRFGSKSGDLPVPHTNPVAGLECFKERPKERYLSIVELRRLGDALAAAETVGLEFEIDENGRNAKHAPKPPNRRRKIDPHALAAIRLLLLTGGRLREILNARWEHLDVDRGCLRLADSKTGARSIYLGEAALQIITCLPRLEGNPYMFPGHMKKQARLDTIDRIQNVRPRSDLKKPWAAVSKAAGLTNVRLHDLRHTFASYGAGAQLGLPIIGKLLGHSQPATTHRYAHLDADPMHRAVELISKTIVTAMANAGARTPEK